MISQLEHWFTSHPRRQSWVVLALMVAFIVMLTWPSVTQLGTHIPGNEGDALVHYWTYHWALEALTSDAKVFYTDKLFFPNGVDLFTHNFAWLNILVWLPLQAVIGGAAAYTLTFLAVPVLNGFAGYLYLKQLFGRFFPSLIGGLVIGGWQYNLTRFNSPNLTFVAFLILSLLFIDKLIKTRRWRYALYLALCVGLAGTARFQVLLMGAPLLLLQMAMSWWGGGDSAETTQSPQPTRAQQLGTLSKLLVAFVVGGVLILPTLGPTLWYQAQRDDPNDIQYYNGNNTENIDVVAYVYPYTHHPLAETVQSYFNPLATLVDTYAVGFLPLLLFVLGCFHTFRYRWLWLLTTVVLFVLALGNVLMVDGTPYMSLPYQLIDSSMLGSIIRDSRRLNIILAIPFAVFVTAGATLLLRKLPALLQPIVFIIIAALFVVEYHYPYPLYALEMPAWYEQLAQDDEAYGILQLPHTRANAEEYMLYQVFHGKKITHGHVSRPPTEAYEFIRSVPLLDYFEQSFGVYYLAAPPTDRVNSNVSAQLNRLAENDIRYVILHKKYLFDEQTKLWRNYLLRDPIHEDDEVIVYTTRPVMEAEFSPLLAVSDTLTLINVDLPTAKTAGGAYNFTLHWLAHEAYAADDDVCLVVQSDVEVVEPLCASLNMDVVAGVPTQLIRTDHLLTVPSTLPSDNYVVSAEIRSQSNQHDPVQYTLGTVNLSQFTRSDEPLVSDEALQISLGASGQLGLQGFDTPTIVDNQLQLDLYYHVREPFGSQVKLFVHVVSAEGALVAQSDSVPLGTDYPPAQWVAGDYLIDSKSLEIAELPAGRYEIYMGMYDAASLERLLAVDGAGNAVPSNYILLTSFEK